MYTSELGSRPYVFYDKLPVVQLSLTGEYMNKFESVRKAGQVLNLYTTGILDAIMGRLLTCGGYIFVMEEYYSPDKKITLKSLKFKRKIRKLCQQ